jgi:methionyl-tRNA formyltransferase
MSLKLLFMGTPAFAVLSLEAIVGGPHQLLAVVTQPDRPAGRGNKPQICAVKKRAREAGVPVFQPASVKEEWFVQLLKEMSPQLIVVTAFGQILPKTILNLPPMGCINVHGSLLPKYRGAAPVQWAILNGEARTGVTVIRLSERMDAGEMLVARDLRIGEDENAQELGERLSRLGAEVLMETISGLERGSIRPACQKEEEASYAPRLSKQDGVIRWDLGAKEIARKIRGLIPWPTAHTSWRGKLLKVYKGRPCPGESPGKPGQVVRADHGSFWVKAGDGVLEILDVQLENRPRMSASTFVVGRGDILGEVLGGGDPGSREQ